MQFFKLNAQHSAYGNTSRINRIRSGILFSALVVWGGIVGCNGTTDPEMVRFDVREGLAVNTLKEAARQAQVEFIFSSELVRGIKTPAIDGQYAPTDVFELMLADSDYIIVQHEQSGVYSIQRHSDK